jgi:leucyl/phenylalanyl-tRNA---protein transferase
MHFGYDNAMQVTPEVLLNAYCQGYFPMADPDEGNKLYWYDPDPRTIIPIESFHVPRRLARTVRQARFVTRTDSAFREVMERCAETAPDRHQTWISSELIDLYNTLHHWGYAHSVETYLDGELVGGVYGVSINGFFAGESMFSRVTDASKVALVHLMMHLRRRNFSLFDVQFDNPHIQQFGTVSLPRHLYKRLLSRALEAAATF